MALSLTANQRQALRDWLDANVPKCVYQDSWTEYQKDPETGRFVLVNTGTAEEPVWERVVVQVHNYSYLDLHELCLRASRKINKHYPDKMADLTLEDLEALVWARGVDALLAIAGVTQIGSSPRRYSEYVNEDPDL